jgi:hypothetical protein
LNAKYWKLSSTNISTSPGVYVKEAVMSGEYFPKKKIMLVKFMQQSAMVDLIPTQIWVNIFN